MLLIVGGGGYLSGIAGLTPVLTFLSGLVAAVVAMMLIRSVIEDAILLDRDLRELKKRGDDPDAQS